MVFRVAFLVEFSNVDIPNRADAGVFKDVRAHNVPMYRFFLNLPRRKVMIYFCQKGKKMGDQRARFRDHEVHL